MIFTDQLIFTVDPALNIFECDRTQVTGCLGEHYQPILSMGVEICPLAIYVWHDDRGSKYRIAQKLEEYDFLEAVEKLNELEAHRWNKWQLDDRGNLCSAPSHLSRDQVLQVIGHPCFSKSQRIMAVA